MLTVAIQYPSFGPQHPPRLRAIVETAPNADTRVVAMEMFRRDSDYEWDPVATGDALYVRYTAMDCSSAEGRGRPLWMKRQVWRALDEIAPDVLVVNGYGHRETLASLAWCRKKKCPWVVLNDSVEENVPRVWWKEWLKRRVLRDSRAGFAAGTPQARYLTRLGVPAEAVFHPGSCVVDNDYWRRAADEVRADPEPHRTRLGLPERYFLSVSRWLDWKNVPFLVRAFARYRAEAGKNAWDLVLCGSGPDEANIRTAIRETGASGVHCPGFLQVGDLPAAYGLAGAFVHASSEFECWGLVVNEAMASGLPVLVSSMVGCAEDLVKDNGFVIDPADEEALAQRMRTISGDESLRENLRRRSREIIAGHSCRIGGENLWKAVRAALGEDGGRK